MRDKMSILVAARRDSKYLAKFLIGCMLRTDDLKNTEILVMLNEHDTWNRDLVRMFSSAPWHVKFYFEDKGLGRAGLHEYFNELLSHATGDWISYFCEDHYIIMNSWDTFVGRMISGNMKVDQGGVMVNQHNEGILDPEKIYCLIPSFDNVGPMNHIVSRGFVRAMDGKISQHGNLDSYINKIADRLPRQRVIRFNSEPPMFHDFTHDNPSPMAAATKQSVSGPAAKLLPGFESDIIQAAIIADTEKLTAAIREGS